MPSLPIVTVLREEPRVEYAFWDASSSLPEPQLSYLSPSHHREFRQNPLRHPLSRTSIEYQIAGALGT